LAAPLKSIECWRSTRSITGWWRSTRSTRPIVSTSTVLPN
jgi:hypothetical protein